MRIVRAQREEACGGEHAGQHVPPPPDQVRLVARRVEAKPTDHESAHRDGYGYDPGLLGRVRHQQGSRRFSEPSQPRPAISDPEAVCGDQQRYHHSEQLRWLLFGQREKALHRRARHYKEDPGGPCLKRRAPISRTSPINPAVVSANTTSWIISLPRHTHDRPAHVGLPEQPDLVLHERLTRHLHRGLGDPLRDGPQPCGRANPPASPTSSLTSPPSRYSSCLPAMSPSVRALIAPEILVANRRLLRPLSCTLLLTFPRTVGGAGVRVGFTARRY